MNVKKVVANLVESENKTVENINFDLKRFNENGFIKKSINFNFEGKSYSFQEKVKMFSLNDFEKLFKLADINLLATYGNYNLDEYNENTSDRLILVLIKNEHLLSSCTAVIIGFSSLLLKIENKKLFYYFLLVGLFYWLLHYLNFCLKLLRFLIQNLLVYL